MEPGVYTHAAVLSNILSQRFLTRPGYVALVEMLADARCSAPLLAVLIPRLKSFTVKGLVIVRRALAGWWAVALFSSAAA